VLRCSEGLLALQVRLMFDIPDAEFQRLQSPVDGNRPRPLYVPTASQIGEDGAECHVLIYRYKSTLSIHMVHTNLYCTYKYDALTCMDAALGANPQTRQFSLNLLLWCTAGILPTPGVPSLLRQILPEGGKGLRLCSAYLRDLLLHPPPMEVAASIQGKSRVVLYFAALYSTVQCTPCT